MLIEHVSCQSYRAHENVQEVLKEIWLVGGLLVASNRYRLWSAQRRVTCQVRLRRDKMAGENWR